MNRKSNKNKKHIEAAAVILLLLCVFSVFTAGCKNKEEKQGTGTDSGKLKVVTTLFPYYDFLRQIADDRIELTLVLPAGMDSHSFEPTPADMITLQSADLIICNGGAMEQWLAKVLDSFDSSGSSPGRVVAMMDYVDVLEEEIVEGMELDGHAHTLSDEHIHEGHNHEEDHIGAEDDGHGSVIEYDEHIWTSPVNAMKLTEVMAAVLKEEDPENSRFYQERSALYVEKLEALHQEFQDIVEHGKRKLIVFGDKFPLRYFFDEYGLVYRAAFTGCSTDTELSARTIAYLIDRVQDERVPAVYYLELSSRRVAEIIGEETGAEPLLFHSCHNVTRQEFDSGITYLELMEQNAVNLRKGLE